jgi:ABC-2 type transport system ATP-binding protein
MNQQYKNDFEQTRSMLQTSPAVGFGVLIDLCRTYGNNDLKLEAILLSGKYNLLPEEAKAGLQAEALAILQKLEKQVAAGESGDAEPPLPINEAINYEKLTRFHVQKTVAEDYVFRCKEIKKSYHKTDFTLQNIDLQLKEGEITGVVGENGNGKSTLLKIIAGELLADEGTISYGVLNNNLAITNWPLIKSRVAYLQQELPVLKGNIRKNLQFSAALHGLTGKRNIDEVNYIIHRMGLSDYADNEWKNLSGGYRLRFSLAKVLVNKPRLIVLDEPLANLDINTQILVLNDLRNMTDITGNRMSVVISSQNLEEVEAVADKMLVLKKGSIHFYGPSSDIGIARKENTFEIKSPLEKDELKLKLSSLSFFNLYDNGFYFIINTPVETDKLRFLKHCADNEIVLDYFNDISSSVKKFIIQNR